MRVTSEATSGKRSAGTSRRIVLTAVGSLGDLHPYLAVAQELGRRGHRPVVATVPGLRERVEAAGVAFAPLRAMAAGSPDAALVRRVFDGSRGVEFIVRELVLPALRTAYEDTMAAAEGADLLVAHPLTWTTRLVAEKRGLPWVSTVLAPTSLLSATDPPLLPGQRWLYRAHPKPWVWRLLYRFADRMTRRWLRPYDALRRELGLSDTGNPLFAGRPAPVCDLALFSPRFGVPQRDWPAGTVATGFPFFEQHLPADPALEAWMAAGSAPLIFTLGSSAVFAPGKFFEQSVEAARRLGRRALLVGPVAGSGMAAGDVFSLPYGSYARLFPQGAVTVHQGGVGTTAEALRAGVPTLVVPFGADQPDNGERVVRLGVGRVLRRGQYRAARVARELEGLLGDPGVASRARALGAALRAERGAARAADLLETILR